MATHLLERAERVERLRRVHERIEQPRRILACMQALEAAPGLDCGSWGWGLWAMGCERGGGRGVWLWAVDAGCGSGLWQRRLDRRTGDGRVRLRAADGGR